MKAWMLAGMLLPAALPVSLAAAQNYPTKAVHMIVPFPPGGPNDILGRVVAQRLSEQLGQQVVIDNCGGAGGIIGAELAARAVADGYTLLFGGTASLAINPSLHKKLPYNPLGDFAAVSLVGTAPSLLTTHPSLPVKNVKDLVVCNRRTGRNAKNRGHAPEPRNCSGTHGARGQKALHRARRRSGRQHARGTHGL